MANLTAVLFDSNLAVVYQGTLNLQFDQYGTTPTGGTLTIGNYPPCQLTQMSGQSIWSLIGFNGVVNVSASWMQSASNAENTSIIQSSVCGTMTVSIQGGAAQNLTIFGWDNSVFPYPPTGSVANAEPALDRKSPLLKSEEEHAQATEADSKSVGVPFPPDDHFNYALTFVGQNTFKLGTGSIVATGHWYPMGPVGRIWRLGGNLTFTGGAACPISGYGAATYWYGNVQGGFGYYDISTLPNQGGTNTGCTGGLLINGSKGGIVFFTGTSA